MGRDDLMEVWALAGLFAFGCGAFALVIWAILIRISGRDS